MWGIRQIMIWWLKCQRSVWNNNTTPINSCIFLFDGIYLPRFFMTRLPTSIFRTYTRTLPVYISPLSQREFKANFASTAPDMSASESSKEAYKPSAFTRLSSTTGDGDSEARLGELALKGRDVIETPNFLAVTSRGVMPHISPDAIPSQATFPGVFTAIEDCSCAHSSMPLAPLWSRAV